MNQKISPLLKKVTLFTGVLFLGWAAKAQSTGTPQSDTTRHHGGMQRHWGTHNGKDSLASRDGFRRGPGVRYTPEQRKQLMAIHKDYRQKSEDLFKKDNSTLKEYKAGRIALQKEKKAKIEALLTPAQKQEMATRKKRMSENAQVRAVAQMERLKLRLNLTDDQIAKIKAGQESLHNQAKAIRDNDNLLPGEKREQMMSLMTKHRDIVKSVLTPEQQTQFEKMYHRRSGFDGRGGRGRRGGFGEGRRGGFGEDRHSSSEDQTK